MSRAKESFVLFPRAPGTVRSSHVERAPKSAVERAPCGTSIATLSTPMRHPWRRLNLVARPQGRAEELVSGDARVASRAPTPHLLAAVIAVSFAALTVVGVGSLFHHAAPAKLTPR
jgi:hypothetical protein